MTVFLKTITLFNFKSFRGETIIGPIQPFTAIIGPNGSGKSNVMDAISFVLGKKLSTLRVKRFNELVYGATIGKPTLEGTYITVVFAVDDKEKSFTRAIHGDGSQYKIDDKIVTKDFYINELKEIGLDVKSGNFLVPQNYIECFATITPKELTVMLEEISGSNIYKADYEKLKFEFLEAKDKVQFAHQMKRQLLSQKRYAIAETTEADKYLQLQKEYMEKKSKFQSIRLVLIKKIVETLQDQERQIKLQMEEYLRDKEKAIFLLDHKKSQFKSLSNSLEAVEQNILKLENILQVKKVDVIFKENILHWQKKRDYARASLDSANEAQDNNKKIIQELKNELKQIGNKLAELKEASQESTIELSNSQVQRYMDLKNKVEYQAKDFAKEINNLLRDQQTLQDKLNNENRCKQELEDKAKRIILMKEDLEKRHKKLQELNDEIKVTEETVKREKLSKELTETQTKLLNLENDIAKISEELCQADIDNYITLQRMKRAETIRTLKQLFSGVYDRLSNLCKPIHPRYKIAVIKVFGKNMDAIVVDIAQTATQCIQFLKQQKMDVETFLPLNSIKTEILKENLRDIKEPKNVKLLYDVLEISSAKINKAVLFVTKNTLVCETAEDARIVAYEINKHRNYDCVSLDGCLYYKSGLLSGGQAELVAKAKQWENQHVLALQERKTQLMQEHRDLIKISVMQNNKFNDIDVLLKGLINKHKYIEINLKNTEEEIRKMEKELSNLDIELSLSVDATISKIQHSMQEKDEKIKDVKRHVNAIEAEIFANFCQDINIPNINYYEKNNLRTYQEQQNRQMELEKHYDRIKNQLRFESECDIKSKILKWEYAMKQAEAKLNEAYHQEQLAKTAIEREEAKLSELKNNRIAIKNNLKDVEEGLAQCRSQIGVISKLYLESQKAYIAVQSKREQKKTEWNTILKECKIEDITIPILTRTPHRRSREFSSTSTSTLNAESSSDCEMIIDLSQFPEDICNGAENDLQDSAKQLKEEFTEIQNQLETAMNPNFKAHEKLDSVQQKISETNEKLQQLHQTSNKIRTQFEKIKIKRYKLFTDCLERVSAEIDSIYKNLVNDMSAQALILSENPEEPYVSGINYSCIAPSKRFQPIQHLSGGEKSLASLALLFAIQRYKPTPFFIMDEGDAALDNGNIKNIVRFIQSEANIMQFITVTLRKSLYCNADALVGVTNEPNVECSESKVFVISLIGYHQKEKHKN